MPEIFLIRLLIFVGVILLAALARSIIGAMDRSKKEAEAEGFVASPLLGPLGVYIALYFYRRKKRLSCKCSYCRESINPKSDSCPHCGYPIASD